MDVQDLGHVQWTERAHSGTPGSTYYPGKTFMGFDLAAWLEDQIREVAEPCPTEQTDLIADTVIRVKRTHNLRSHTDVSAMAAKRANVASSIAL